MVDQQTLRVWEWIADFAGTHDTPISLDTICAASVTRTGMSGAWVSRGNRHTESVHVTDALAGHLEQLQFLLGEGPAVDAVRDGEPVEAADLSSAGSRRTWPVFAPPAAAAGALSVFAVPMRVGSALVGVLGLYSRAPTVLSAGHRAELGSYADVVLGLVLDRNCAEPSHVDRVLADSRSLHRAEVHQATGMVSAQLGVDVTESLARLRAHAFAQGRSLIEIAREVVTRRLRFSDHAAVVLPRDKHASGRTGRNVS